MKTIIVPTDFSPVSTNAMNYAIDLALDIKADLILFHVYQVPVAMSEVPVLMPTEEEVEKESREKMMELKRSVEHISSGKLKVDIEVRLGNVVDELEDFCKVKNPYAVVMGSKGASGMERVIFGSITLLAIRHLTCPIICVPPGIEYRKIKKIGFACDFQKVQESTPVAIIKSFVKDFGASIEVLNVDFHNKGFKPETPEQAIQLHNMLSELNPNYHFISHPDIEDGINEFAEKNNLDLLITIPKKHKLLDAIFKPSSTRQLVFHSHVPVMCVHEA